MKTFKQFVAESINDKGILKAVFVIGIPGAGKSYAVKKLSGTISPRVVNTDRATEHMGQKQKMIIRPDNWPELADRVHSITKATLLNYIDSLLPLFIDGTSNDVSSLLHRIGILESIGYDVGVVFINTDIEVALQRVKARENDIKRSVDPEFVKKVAELNRENAAFLKSKVSFFRELDNNDQLDDDALLAAFKAVHSFFDSPLRNPVGKRLLDEMREKKIAYLSDGAIDRDVLEKKISGWYRS